MFRMIDIYEYVYIILVAQFGLKRANIFVKETVKKVPRMFSERYLTIFALLQAQYSAPRSYHLSNQVIVVSVFDGKVQSNVLYHHPLHENGISVDWVIELKIIILIYVEQKHSAIHVCEFIHRPRITVVANLVVNYYFGEI